MEASVSLGFWCSILWCSNSVLSWPLSWTAAYNQVLCALVFLAALTALQKYAETGNSNYGYLHWLIFLAGFGVLEITVVYPFIALAFTMLFCPRLTKATLPMFIPSIIFAALHSYLAPKSSDGTYGIAIDWRVPKSLISYWVIAFLPESSKPLLRLPAWLFDYLRWVLAAVTALFLAERVRRIDRLVLFGLAWFFATVSPYLVVPNHISDYYLFVPTIGLSMAASRAVVDWPSKSFPGRLGVAAVMSVWLTASWLTAWRSTAKSRQDSEAMRTLVYGVQQVLQAHPGRVVFLTGINDGVFWSGVYDHPFRLLGPRPVYLSPTDAATLTPYPDLVNIDDYTLPAQVASRIMEQGDGVVYRLEEDRLRNVSARETRGLSLLAGIQGLPWHVRLGDPHYAFLLDTRWFQAESGFRWMPQAASLFIHGPSSKDQTVRVSGRCAASQVARGPIRLTVSIDGRPNPAVEITNCDSALMLRFPVPASSVGKERIEVTFEIDRVLQEPGGSRLLGMALTEVQIR